TMRDRAPPGRSRPPHSVPQSSWSMREHPSDDQLDQLLAGTLPPALGNALHAHLRERCPECRKRLVRRAVRAHGLLPSAAQAPTFLEGYDIAIARAFAGVRRQARVVAGERREVGEDLAALLVASVRATPAGSAASAADRRTGGWALTEELLALARELR